MDILGGVAQLVSAGINNAVGYAREKEARKENYEYNEMAANNADARTRKLYQDLQSPYALLQQYQQAGLSPSLMFGGSGVGAGGMSTGAQGNGASGINPTTFGIDPVAAAQVQLMQAQTRKTNAEAANEEGTGAIGAAQILNLVNDAHKKEVEAAYTEAQKAGQEWINKFNNATEGAQITKLNAEADIAAQNYTKLIYDTISAAADANVATNTIAERIQSVTLDNDLKSAKKIVELTSAGLNLAQQDYLAGQLAIQKQQLRLNVLDLLVQLRNSKNETDANRIQKEWFDEQYKIMSGNLENEQTKTRLQGIKLQWETYKEAHETAQGWFKTIFDGLTGIGSMLK